MAVAIESTVRAERTRYVGGGVVLTDWTVRRPSFELGPITTRLQGARITAIVGANGAGKTTLLRSLAGQLPASGEAQTASELIRPREPRWRQMIGFVPDDPEELLPDCTAQELWSFIAGVHSRGLPRHERRPARERLMARAGQLAAQLGYAPPAGKPLAEYSLGMRKKAQIVAAMMHEPLFLMMDEPRNGLDPFGIERLYRITSALAQRGPAILVATHDLDWALHHADRIIALRRGALVLDSTTASVNGSGGAAVLLETLL
jgi:ABC-type multidrug transport system ATPase subunit